MACERSAAEGGAVQARRIHCPCRVGRGAHLQLGSAQPTCPVDPATDAPAQRQRGVEQNEKDGLAAMPPTRPLTCCTTYVSHHQHCRRPHQHPEADNHEHQKQHPLHRKTQKKPPGGGADTSEFTWRGRRGGVDHSVSEPSLAVGSFALMPTGGLASID